jgi:hypothetical protein
MVSPAGFDYEGWAEGKLIYAVMGLLTLLLLSVEVTPNSGDFRNVLFGSATITGSHGKVEILFLESPAPVVHGGPVA